MAASWAATACNVKKNAWSAMDTRVQSRHLVLTTAFHRTVTTPFEAVSQSKGALHTIAAPSPRAPHPGSDSATVNVLLRHQHEGDISNEVTMGTFLTR